ncbi:MAG: archaellin/type IV pilin N-terminal domain-containing protein [Candidatus Aenigmatarchaeota archaeon]
MKGVSPLIATVILIVITVGVGFGLWLYINSYISSQTSNIPKICQANFDVSGKFNKTHLSLSISYLFGPELSNLTLNLLCYSNQNFKSLPLLEKMKVGMTILNLTQFDCPNKYNLEIAISAICENQAHTVYKCSGTLCNILEE